MQPNKVSAPRQQRLCKHLTWNKDPTDKDPEKHNEEPSKFSPFVYGMGAAYLEGEEHTTGHFSGYQETIMLKMKLWTLSHLGEAGLHMTKDPPNR